MQKHQSVRLSGEEFCRASLPAISSYELFKAYMTHNEAYRGANFPEPKFKKKTAKSNPEKFNAEEEYKAAIRKFIGARTDTVKGWTPELVDLNPYPRWASLEGKQNQLLDVRAFLAEERYLAARTNTDLDGHGSFAGVAPGKYWIGMTARKRFE